MSSRGLLKQFFRCVSLSVLGMLGLSCYILADTCFVARRLGADGLAALNLAIPVYSLIHGCGLMLGMGGSTRCAILSGRRKAAGARRVFSHSLGLAALMAAVFVPAGLFFAEKLAVLLGAGAGTFSMARTYLKVLLLFSPAFLLNDVLLCFVRADGGPGLAMAAMLSGSFLNILLDYLFLFPLGLGIFGAVFATGLSPVLSVLLLSLHWRKKTDGLRPAASRPCGGTVLDILSLGFPSLVAELASGVVMMVFNRIILGLAGNPGVAAYGIIANLSLMAVAVFTGAAQGVQPLAGSAHGRKDTGASRRLLAWSLTALALLSGGIYAVLFCFAEQIVRWFNSEGLAALQNIAVPGLKTYFTALPFAGFNLILSAFFTSAERPRPARAVALLRGAVLIIPAAFLLSSLAGITGVWISFPAAEAASALCAALLWLQRSPKPDLKHRI